MKYSRAIKVILACKGVRTKTNSLIYCTLLHDAYFGRYDRSIPKSEINHPVRHDPNVDKALHLEYIKYIDYSLLQFIDDKSKLNFFNWFSHGRKCHSSAWKTTRIAELYTFLDTLREDKPNEQPTNMNRIKPKGKWKKYSLNDILLLNSPIGESCNEYHIDKPRKRADKQPTPQEGFKIEPTFVDTIFSITNRVDQMPNKDFDDLHQVPSMTHSTMVKIDLIQDQWKRFKLKYYKTLGFVQMHDEMCLVELQDKAATSAIKYDSPCCVQVYRLSGTFGYDVELSLRNDSDVDVYIFASYDMYYLRDKDGKPLTNLSLMQCSGMLGNYRVTYDYYNKLYRFKFYDSQFFMECESLSIDKNNQNLQTMNGIEVSWKSDEWLKYEKAYNKE